MTTDELRAIAEPCEVDGSGRCVESDLEPYDGYCSYAVEEIAETFGLPARALAACDLAAAAEDLLLELDGAEIDPNVTAGLRDALAAWRAL